MRLVPLIAAIAGCSAPAAPKPVAHSVPPAAETLWDRGTFVAFENEKLVPDTEESFEIYQRDDTYRFVVKWKRPTPTGERADGEVELVTDAQFSPLQGKDTSTIHYSTRDEVAYSTLTREADGTLLTEQIRGNGEKDTNRSSHPNDWYIGGQVTTFIAPLCAVDASVTRRIAYPDKVTTLEPFQPLAVDGTQRTVTSRVLTYEQSGRKITAACEGGKLAGEIVRGTAIVRSGDVALARALVKEFR